MNTALIGSWISDPEFESSNQQEKTRIDFYENGDLTYTDIGEEKDQLIFLTYRIENDYIITDQPSHPQEARTKFSITPDGKLLLTIADRTYRYIRLKQVK